MHWGLASPADKIGAMKFVPGSCGLRGVGAIEPDRPSSKSYNRHRHGNSCGDSKVIKVTAVWRML